MRERYLSQKCRNCLDNNKSQPECYDNCGVPGELLDRIEEINKKVEEFLEARNDKSQH